MAEQIFADNQAVFFLRMKPGGKPRVQYGLETNRIVIGWARVPGLIDIPDDQMAFRRAIRKVEIQDPRQEGKDAAALRRFLKHMQPGDLVLVPSDNEGSVNVARVAGPPDFDQERVDDDIAYYRPVKWLSIGDLPFDWKKPGRGVVCKPIKITIPSAAPQPSSCPLNTIFYGPPGTGKTYATFQRCVDICDGENDALLDVEVQSRYEELMREEQRVEFVTFHQSYGYEEFVEGLRPAKDSQHLKLEPTDGVLKRIAEHAEAHPNLPHVLVIDEINRANVSKVLGELITLLEEDKRKGEDNEVAVTLPYSGKQFTLPRNLHVLGTMNTADRSIALIDTALRRRFRFEELAPKPELLGSVDGIDLANVLTAINERLEYLIDRDHLIGHAWLMGVKSKAELDDVMRHKIIPLIAEYFYDDWQKVRAVLGGTDHFVAGKELNPPPGLGDGEGHEKRWSWAIQKAFGEGAYESLVAGK